VDFPRGGKLEIVAINLETAIAGVDLVGHPAVRIELTAEVETNRWIT
jgi:hypothetical protein